MDAEQFQELLVNRDAARDTFLEYERKLFAAVNGNDGKGGGLAVRSEVVIKRAAPANGKAAGIERVKRAVASKRESAPKESSKSRGRKGGLSELHEKLLKMIASGNKTLPQLCAPFEKEMSDSAIYQQVYKLRGMNFVDREGDGYCIKPAGRAWLNENGEGK